MQKSLKFVKDMHGVHFVLLQHDRRIRRFVCRIFLDKSDELLSLCYQSKK